MSDATPLWRSMNGLAAWFNAQGGLLQSGAWLGALIALTMAIFGTAVGKSSISTGVIGTWFFFMCSMGMTGTANVVNVYTGTVTTVANVPALALVPASIFSNAAYKVFTTMETAFSSTTGSYMSVSTNGFVGPLDLLLTLRSNNFPSSHPALQRTLVQVISDCGIDTASTATPSVSMKDTLDILTWLKTYGKLSGITNVYSELDVSGKGTIYSCNDALIYLDAQYNSLASGNSDMIAFINANSGKTNPASATGNWGSTAITNSFDTLLGGITSVTQNSIQFTKNALVSSTVAGTIDCLGNSGLMTSPDTCATSALVLSDGKERWKTDAVMNGSGFVKIIFTSMGFLQVLFFALFPFIALYGLIVINKTVSVFGGYVLFGIWSQSWMLVVAPIQSYIQNSVIDELTRAVGSSGGLTLANQSSVYTVLSDKLAVASDMMANSQMLSLALLSGSIYALSGLVGKSSGSQHMDSGLIQRRIGDGSALTSGGTVMTMNTMSNNDGSSLVVGTRTGASSVGLGASNVTTLFAGSSSGTDHSISAEQSQTEDRMKQELAKWGYLKEESAAISKSVSNTLGYQGSINSSIGSGFIKALRSSAGKGGVPLTAQQEKMAGEMFSAAQSTAVNKLVSSDKSFWSKLNSTNPDEKSEAYQKVADVAMDSLDAIGTGASIASIGMSGGASTPVAVGAIAGIKAMKGIATGMIKGQIKEHFKAEAKDAAKTALANGATSTLRNLTSGFGEAVAGGVGAVATAAHQEVFKKDNGVAAKRGLGRDSSDSASVSAALRKTVGDSFKFGYSESASQSYVQTAAVNKDVAGLARSVENGYGDQSGKDMREGLAFNKSVLTTNGQFSARNIKAAEMKTKDVMSGYVFNSTTSGVSSDEVRTGVSNALFQQFLTNKVQTSFNSSYPQSAGSDLIQKTPHLKTPDTDPTTQGRYGPAKTRASGTPTPVKNSYLVDARNGEVSNVPDDKTIVQKVNGAINGVKSLFTSGKPSDSTSTSVETTATTPGEKRVINPNKASSKVVSYPPASASTRNSTSSQVKNSSTLDPLNTANYVFEQQPATDFAHLPPLVNQTSADREKFISGGAGRIKGVIDAASRKQEGEFAKSANPNATLANWKISGQYSNGAADQQSLVNDAVVTALGVGLVASAAGGIAEILGQGGGKGQPAKGNPYSTSTPGTATGAGAVGSPNTGSSDTNGPPKRVPVNPNTFKNRSQVPRFKRNR